MQKYAQTLTRDVAGSSKSANSALNLLTNAILSNSSAFGVQAKAAQEAVEAQKRVAAEASLNAAKARLESLAARAAGAENAAQLAKEAQAAAAASKVAAAGLKVAEGEAQNLAQSAAGAGAAFAELINPVTIAIAVIAAAAVAAVTAAKALYDLAESGSAFGEKIFESARKTGLSTESVSALSLAANSAGLEFSKLEPGLIIFEKLLGNAADGAKKATKILKNIGIDSKTGFQDLQGSLEQVFKRATELGTAVERTKLFTDAFGKSGSEMSKIYDETKGNLAEYTKELEKAGLTLSGEDTKASHDFQKALRELHYEIETLTVKFVRDYLPQLTSGIKTIGDIFKSNESAIKSAGQAVGEFLTGLGKIASFIDSSPILKSILLEGVTGTIRGVLGATTLGLSEVALYGAKGVSYLGSSGGATISDPNDRFHQHSTGAADVSPRSITVQLPNSGQGFATYGGRVDQFGTKHTIESLERLAASFQEATGKFISIGNIAQSGGGNYGSHTGHGAGDSADIRPLTKNGSGSPVKYTDSNYDRDATRELINLIKQQNANAKVLFNDPELIKEGLTSHYSGHDNHLHVKLPSSAGKPYVGAEDEDKIQKALEKEATKAFKARLLAIKTQTKEELEANRDAQDELKAQHEKELASPQKVYEDEKALNAKFTAQKIADIKAERAAYVKETAAFEEKPEDVEEKLADFDSRIKDAQIESDRKNRDLKTELHKSQLELSKKHFGEREALQKELDNRQIQNITENADKEVISYKGAEDEIYKIRATALDRLAAQYAEETRINAAGGKSKTEQEKIDHETALNKQARESLDLEHGKNTRDAIFKDNQKAIEGRAQQNRIFEAEDQRHYENLQNQLDNFLITKQKFATESAKIDETALARQIALKQLELGNNINNPAEYKRITDEIAALDRAFAALREANQHKIATATKETTDAMKAQVAEAQALKRQSDSDAANIKIRGLEQSLNEKGYISEASRIYVLEQIRALKLKIIENDYAAAEAQDAIDKKREEDEIGAYEDKKKRQEEIDEKYADRKKNRDAAKQADKTDVNQNTEGQTTDKSTGLLDDIHAGFDHLRTDKTIQNAGGALTEFGKIGLGVFGSMKQALGASIEQWVLYGGSISKALKAALAAQLAHLAGVAAVKAIEATALGFLDLAYGNFAGAGHAFVSAALWASLAVGSAVAGRALAGNQSAASSSFDSQTSSNANGGTGSGTNAQKQGSGEAGGYYSSESETRTFEEDRLRSQQPNKQVIELHVKSNDSHIVNVVNKDIDTLGKTHGTIVKVVRAA